MAQEKYDEAESLFRQAIENAQTAAGPDGVELTVGLLQLARALWRQGDQAGAQTAMARCVKIQERAFANPANEPALRAAQPEGTTLVPIGQDEWLLYQGDYAAAVRGFRAKAAFEDKQGRPLDPDELPYWEKVAEAEEALGNFNAARDAYFEAAAKWEQRCSAGHPLAVGCRTRATRMESQVES